MKEINWIKLHKFTGRIYADMAMDILTQNDIPCMLQAGTTSFYGAGTTTLMGDPFVLVPEEKYDEAVTILDDIMDVE